MIKAVFIVGPTASGKTSLSIQLAKKFDGEIISADSMQIYKGIHIASAAPDESEKCGVPHHLIEFLETDQEYSVADYVKSARECIKDISCRGKLPIIVGGTGLYITSLLDNIEYTEVDTDYSLRQSLEEKFSLIGGEEMLKELAEFDPQTASELHPNNKRRIIRAFEVYLQTGNTKTQQNILSKQNKGEILPLVIGVNFKDRQRLYDRINLRVDLMMQNGLLEEANSIYSMANQKGAFQAIGHKELYKYFENECSLEEAVEHLKQQTRRYAKRQMTWFNKDTRINWLYHDTDEVSNKAEELVNEFLKEE